MYRILYAHDVLAKDIPKLKSANLLKQFFEEIDAIKENPNIGKILIGPLKGKRSVRISLQHRIFYTFDNNEITIEKTTYDGTINILQAFGHEF